MQCRVGRSDGLKLTRDKGRLAASGLRLGIAVHKGFKALHPTAPRSVRRCNASALLLTHTGSPTACRRG